ncbi:PIN domain-containing protein [Candidatus Pacearchaeota archaeon]|nr:PIN domain-containing protein [Candidatus Pacearchaeota archaeon]
MACLDTSFIIDLLKGSDSAKNLMEDFESFYETINMASPSVVELIRGANKPKVKNEREKIINFLSSLIVLPLDKESAILAGDIEADLINRGAIIDVEDIMIAAIAIRNNEVLITKNKKHFERIKDLKIRIY